MQKKTTDILTMTSNCRNIMTKAGLTRLVQQVQPDDTDEKEIALTSLL